jgi:hypothetical protein
MDSMPVIFLEDLFPIRNQIFHPTSTTEHGAACVSAYALSRPAVQQIFDWHKQEGSVTYAIWKYPTWDYAIIEDLVNILAWGPFENRWVVT